MSQKHLVIGVCGGSGSGKTTFVNKLREIYGPEDICYLSSDNYYHPKESQLVDSNGIRNFDLPEAIDVNRLTSDIESLISGKSITKTEYTFNNSKATAREIQLHPKKIFIIEGLFIYHYKALQKYFDLKLFVHASDVIKVLRRINRDKTERNYPLSDVTYRYQYHVLPAYDKFISLYKDEADLVINNNRSFDKALSVVSAYIKQQLKAHLR